MPKWDNSCSTARRERMVASFNDFMGHDTFKKLPKLKKEITRRWDSVRIECGNNDDPDDEECDGLDGAWSDERILICVTSPRRIKPVLLHELVHDVGGSELDSEAVERAVFEGRGAEPPNGDDWEKFWEDTETLNGDETQRVGEFVIWDSSSGRVWVKETSDGNVTKGTELFQDEDWKHKYSFALS